MGKALQDLSLKTRSRASKKSFNKMTADIPPPPNR